MKRLGVLVIGDEILAGHVQESNSHWLAKHLKAMGITMARVEICTDELPDIEASVRRFLYDLDLDYVITSGGLGPTPDDRTMEGIARAVGVDLELTDDNWTWMKERVAYGHEMGYFHTAQPNAGMKKMAYLPKGATRMPNHIGTCLGAIVKAGSCTLFTLPGVPREFERMFEETIAPQLEGASPLHVEELMLYTEESRFYEQLVELEKKYPAVIIGSYPQRGHILLRATGAEADAMKVIAELRETGQAYLEPRKR